jgi:long-chain acyl-CoA synthetase
MLAVAAQACIEEPKLVHQAATGDSNPNTIDRIVGLVGLYKRRHFQGKDTGFKLVNEVVGRMEPRAVSTATFEKFSVPMFNSAAKKASTLLDRARPRWGGGRVVSVIDRMKTTVDRVEQITHETKEAFEMFRPFTIENAYIFRSDNIRSLFGRIRKEEQGLLTWDPETFDWYEYWLNIHMPGLKKWVFPTLEEDMRAQPKRIYTYRDLLELFETSTKRHATRVAMRIERDGRNEQYTYADMRELATRAAGFLRSEGISPGDRVMLVSHNAPEWGMTYFGVLKAGASCIPVDPESSLEEIVNFARAGEAAGIVLSEKLSEEHSGLSRRLAEEGLVPKMWTFDQVFALTDQQTEDERISLLPARVTANRSPR